MLSDKGLSEIKARWEAARDPAHFPDSMRLFHSWADMELLLQENERLRTELEGAKELIAEYEGALTIILGNGQPPQITGILKVPEWEQG